MANEGGASPCELAKWSFGWLSSAIIWEESLNQQIAHPTSTTQPETRTTRYTPRQPCCSSCARFPVRTSDVGAGCRRACNLPTV